MKTILFPLLFCSFFSAFAQMTSIPDANFESALVVLGYDALPLDGQVPTANISSLTLLDVSSKNIADLTGIQDFSAVETLDLGNNVLTSLDLSQNTNLEQLYILYNPLTCVNLQNGNNENIVLIGAFQCPELTCIQVDDAAYSDTNWVDNPSTPITEFIFDPQIVFSDYCDDCNVSVTEVNESNIELYPNPSVDYLSIKGLSSSFEISIFNSIGQLLFKDEKASVDKPIDIQKFNSGMLLVRIKFDGEIYHRTILKE